MTNESAPLCGDDGHYCCHQTAGWSGLLSVKLRSIKYLIVTVQPLSSHQTRVILSWPSPSPRQYRSDTIYTADTFCLPTRVIMLLMPLLALSSQPLTCKVYILLQSDLLCPISYSYILIMPSLFLTQIRIFM